MLCDPVLNVVCDCFKYTLKLEESVKNNVEGEIEEVNDDEEATVLQDLKTLFEPEEQQSQDTDSMMKERTKGVKIGCNK